MMSAYALIYIAAYMVPALVGFATLIVYTHLLSPAEYGVYVIGISVSSIVSALFFTWVRLSVARYQAKSPDLDLRAEAVAAYGLTALVIAVLTPLAVIIAGPHFGFGIIVVSVFVSLANCAFDIGLEFKRAQLNAMRFSTIAILRSLLSLLLGYFAIKLGGGGLGVLIAFGISFLIAGALSVQSSPLKMLRGFAAGHLPQFMRYGLPFSLGAVTISLHNALDRLGVAYLLGQSAAGYYGLAADLPRQVINLLASSVASAMFPITFRSLAETGAGATRERLKEGAEIMLALIAPAAIWLGLCANPIAETLLGSQFQSGVAALLPLLAVGRLCGAFNQYYMQVSFQLAERPMLQVAHDCSILIVNASLLFPLTLGFGLFGAAAAVLIAEAFGLVFGIWLSRRGFKLPFDGWGVTRVFASTAIMAVVTYAAKTAINGHGLLSLIGVAAAGGVAYAGAAFLFDVGGVRSTTASFITLRRASLSKS
jgi:O-antigen/teichoic acid export membrane protein